MDKKKTRESRQRKLWKLKLLDNFFSMVNQVIGQVYYGWQTTYFRWYFPACNQPQKLCGYIEVWKGSTQSFPAANEYGHPLSASHHYTHNPKLVLTASP